MSIWRMIKQTNLLYYLCDLADLKWGVSLEVFLYVAAGVLFAVSFAKDRTKTKMALKKAWKSLEKILPQLLGIVFVVGILLALFDAQTISTLIGSESGIIGILISAIVGAITLIPGFVAFPTAALLLDNGAGYMQVAAFVSTLMMVGVATAPVEIRCFGKKLTLIRNLMAFVFSFIVAMIIGQVVRK